MTEKYDIAIIGAGPAGLMAARTAAESGLKVLLVERKSDPTKNQRLCGQFTNISLINVGGRLKYGYTKPVSFEIGTEGVKLHFTEFGFHLDYNGPLRPYMNYIYVSPSGNLVYREKNRLFGFFCDKEALLSGVFRSVERLGVKVMTGTFGTRAENTGHGVEVTLKTPAGEEKVTASKCIAADGKESAIAESAGLNAGRKVLSRTPIRLTGYMLEGVTTELRINSWMNITVPSLHPAGNFWMYMLADDCNMVGGGAPPGRSPSENVDALMRLPALRPWFEKSRVVRRFAVASGGPVYAPNPEPVVGNVMAIGDAAALVEVTNPGAIACGYAAAKALIREMNGDRKAMAEYFRWWQSSFDTNDAEYLKAAGRNFMVNAVCNDGEIDYLYGLLRDRVGLPAAGIAENMERVRAERPELYQKLSRAGMASNVADVRLNLSDVLNTAERNSQGVIKS